LSRMASLAALNNCSVSFIAENKLIVVVLTGPSVD